MFRIKEWPLLIYMPQAKFDSYLYLQNFIQDDGVMRTQLRAQMCDVSNNQRSSEKYF